MKSKVVIAAVVSLFSLVVFAGPKNVILFIGDGMSAPQRMLAEAFARITGRDEPVLDRMPYQSTMRTYSASAFVTDSAAAATAFACGVKTVNNYLGVDPDGRSVPSCAEVAKAAGKRVGIVTTVTINHATPGGFYAHRRDRGDGYRIGLDLVASGFDYFAGGALTQHDDRKCPDFKGDIYDLAREAGYAFVNCDRAAFDALKPGCGKAWYVATPGPMPFAIDADEWKDAATLAEMTAKGLELLENEKGLFMMVEGGKIDYSCHANDTATCLREVLALDDAVRVAVDWRKTRPDTLIIVTGDHETGGLAIGVGGTGSGVALSRLTRQRRSAERVKDFVRAKQPKTIDDLMPFLEENFGFCVSDDVARHPLAITPDEKKELAQAFEHDLDLARRGLKDDERYNAAKITRLPATIKRIYARKCGVAWSTGSHTALPVLTTAVGPGAERFSGFLDNADMGRILKDLVRE